MTAPLIAPLTVDADAVAPLAVSVRTACRMLDTAERTLRRMIAEGTLPVVRVPGVGIRIRIADLENLLLADHAVTAT